ncbi:MAG: TIGR01212 family radical SAM protein, partial [Treponema sp.]|nr:TIGR01212 family radical SAM protein [Treponema sp.]
MQTVDKYYHSLFGSKTYKISLDAGCTCPTRDGSIGYGGCIFCGEKGSGDFAASRLLSIPEQVASAKKLVDSKFSRKTARG